ncbi:hypothetical protein TL16_g04150 [Triparma laevis f. inornata]|uniref:Uncharacterized protein n=1 Tax=Triparma laevis f. inornata TaxID=1714386 RepID=A0A9W7A3P4_9STRA|nr:hypothetical protein TL16_g04150 [Triparma laevis f. inornata]
MLTLIISIGLLILSHPSTLFSLKSKGTLPPKITKHFLSLPRPLLKLLSLLTSTIIISKLHSPSLLKVLILTYTTLFQIHTQVVNGEGFKKDEVSLYIVNKFEDGVKFWRRVYKGEVLAVDDLKGEAKVVEGGGNGNRNGNRIGGMFLGVLMPCMFYGVRELVDLSESSGGRIVVGVVLGMLTTVEGWRREGEEARILKGAKVKKGYSFQKMSTDYFNIIKHDTLRALKNVLPVILLVAVWWYKLDVWGMIKFIFSEVFTLIGVVCYVDGVRLFSLVYLRNKTGEIVGGRTDCWEGFWKMCNGLGKMDVEALCGIVEKWEGDGTEEVLRVAEEKVLNGGRREEVKNRERLEKAKEGVRKRVEGQYQYDGVSELLKVVKKKG